jgi:hypothetical protein
MIAGGSMGMASWSWAVAKACRQLRAQLPASLRPAETITVRADTTSDVAALPDLLRHSFGAQFADQDPGLKDPQHPCCSDAQALPDTSGFWRLTRTWLLAGTTVRSAR